MSSTTAEIELTASTRRLPSALRQALKMVQGFVHATTGLMNPNKSKDPDKPLTAGGATIAHALGGVASNLAMRGIDLMVAEGKKVLDFNKELIRLGIDLRKKPGEMEPVGKGIRDISSATGLGAIEVLKAARAYADLAGAEALIDEHGGVALDRISLISRAAQASGSDVGEMAELMFTLTENMKVPPSQLEDTLGGLINQAKDGSIHFKELAHELVALGAVYSQFGTTGRTGVIQLGAQMQLARHAFGSASEAGTGVLRIYRSLPQHASKFAKAGVEIFKPGSKTELQTFEDIIHQIQKSKLSLDREALMKSFGRTEGERFYQVLTSLTDQYDKLKAAGMANGVVAKDLSTYTESSAGRMEVAVERMRNAFAEALTPERIDQIVVGIERIAGSMGGIIAMIERVSDGFAAMIYLARKAGDQLSNIQHRKNTEEEQDIEDQVSDMSLGNKPTDQSVVAKWKAIQQRREQYDTSMEYLLAKESPTGITDGSVRAAILDTRAKGSTPQAEANREAGRAYLKDRTIPDFVMRRVTDTIDREEKESNAKQMSEHIGAAVREAMKDGFRSLFSSPMFSGPMDVTFDANSGGRAIAHSTDWRRR